MSACLLGESCRYDGASAKKSARSALLPLLNDANKTLVAVCPEELGGLGTPREPANLMDGTGADVLAQNARVCTHSGKDVTEGFLKGADRTLDIARSRGATHACLKARSPSCGSLHTHTVAGVVRGQGVSAALLQKAGLKLCSEETLAAFLDETQENEDGPTPSIRESS